MELFLVMEKYAAGVQHMQILLQGQFNVQK